MKRIAILIMSVFFTLYSMAQNKDKKLQKIATDSISHWLKNYNQTFPVAGNVKLDTVIVNSDDSEIRIDFNGILAYIPFRENSLNRFYHNLRLQLGADFTEYEVQAFANHRPIQQLIPNYYRNELKVDNERMPKRVSRRTLPVTQNLSKPYITTKGLFNRNICLWHSHGWYYESLLDRWEWQRARLFQTVEDLYPMSFTVQYITPMLENAGANVFMPRERDTQINEVIVDNITGNESYIEKADEEKYKWQTNNEKGFAVGNPPYTIGDNPFKTGSYVFTKSDKNPSASIEWIPDMPETGEYAVYISYISNEESVDDAHYSVYHSGGITKFSVNQKMGGGTWIYLGTFHFNKGKNPDVGKVMLTNESRKRRRIVTADAVRFGGGMGNVARNGKTSGRPRFVEGARYYLQYAGMPDTLVYDLNNNEDDYGDDYQSRGEWVSYLKGAPSGPTKNRDEKGLGIPIDLSFAFHTDAGVSFKDNIIGTLMIYSTEPDSGYFPDGMSRMASRDFSDMLQSQIVGDIRAKYDSTWTRRGLWDREYSEAYRPTVPAALLELLSHQNFADMKFGHDPRFKFDVSRAIYKAMLRFLAFQYDFEYVVQPLPVSHFNIQFLNHKDIKLSWQPTVDILESTAVAKKYIVYTKTDDNGFDNGIMTDKPELVMENLTPGKIYSYKVTALNEGGESFPSETLSVCRMDNDKPTVLIINGFDRIAPPATLETEKYKGFFNTWDEGVPYQKDLCYTGKQYNFDMYSEWLDDDSPGFGASYGNFETEIIAGNTFDYSYIHGKALKENGYSFVSVSDESVSDKKIDIAKYQVVDLLLGEEKKTPVYQSGDKYEFETMNKAMQEVLKEYTDNGGSVFISGAYIGSDLCRDKKKDNPDRKFVETVLKYKWRTDHAATTGEINAVSEDFDNNISTFAFCTDFNSRIYKVEAPDGIEPADNSDAKTIMRYNENNISAAVAYKGKYKIVAFGFPFETIEKQEHRNDIMKNIMDFLIKNE